MAAEAGARRGRAAAGRRPRLAAVWRAYALLGSVCFGAGADKINGFRAVTARATFLCFSRALFSTASGNTGGRRLEHPLRSSVAAALWFAKLIGQQRVHAGLGPEHAPTRTNRG